MTFAFDPSGISLRSARFIDGRYVAGAEDIGVAAPSDGRALTAVPRAGAGSFFRPAILSGVDAADPAVSEEIFGPVATFQTFDTGEEALHLAAHPAYGLCAGLFTRDRSRGLRLARQIQAGTVRVNRCNRSRDHIPPTGGWKAGGLGKDLGREACRANRRSKSVLIAL